MARRNGGVSQKTSRDNRRITDPHHDAYKARTKLPEPTLCPDCGAVYAKGRWMWSEVPPDTSAHREACPACQRSRDRYPAGIVSLGGRFYRSHRDEIVNLIRNEEYRIRTEHPLHRIIAMEDRGEGLSISTTDTHLPRRIGEALRKAYKGDLAMTYAEGDRFVRVQWHR